MKTFTVLVIEDNPFTREIVRITLSSSGFEVLEAPDGRVGLSLMAEHRPDLILQDLVLPDIDGVNLLRRLRAFPGGEKTPILAFSAFGSELREMREWNAGFSEYLEKPIEPEELLAIVKRYAERAQTAQGE